MFLQESVQNRSINVLQRFLANTSKQFDGLGKKMDFAAMRAEIFRDGDPIFIDLCCVTFKKGDTSGTIHVISNKYSTQR